VTGHSPTLGLALFVAAAGGLGALARAVLIHHASRRRPDPLPYGTLLVNTSGSLVLGVLTGCAMYHGLGPHELSVAGVGLCGGYTTWSTASWESVHLVRSGHRSEAIIYTFGGLGSCIAAAAAGIWLTGLL
jgi:CrcB protein